MRADTAAGGAVVGGNAFNLLTPPSPPPLPGKLSLSLLSQVNRSRCGAQGEAPETPEQLTALFRVSSQAEVSAASRNGPCVVLSLGGSTARFQLSFASIYCLLTGLQAAAAEDGDSGHGSRWQQLQRQVLTGFAVLLSIL